MTLLGMKLRRPALSDLPDVAISIVFAGALVAFLMLVLGWSLAQSSPVIIGCLGAAIGSAIGVDHRTGRWRSWLLVALIVLALFLALKCVQLVTR